MCLFLIRLLIIISLLCSMINFLANLISGTSVQSVSCRPCSKERKLKVTLMKTPTKNEPGIIQRKEIVAENNSCEKLIRVATKALINVPIKVAVGFALLINIAIKNGTNRGPTSRLIVLYVSSSRLPLTLPITRLNKTIMTPMPREMICRSRIRMATPGSHRGITRCSICLFLLQKDGPGGEATPH